MKMVKPSEKQLVQVIGCLNECDFKKVNKKNIKGIFKGDKNKWYFPCPDYGTRRQIFKHMIDRAGGKLTSAFDLNTLAHMTERYPAGSVPTHISLTSLVSVRHPKGADHKEARQAGEEAASNIGVPELPGLGLLHV
jgi:hypothetical protein